MRRIGPVLCCAALGYGLCCVAVVSLDHVDHVGHVGQLDYVAHLRKVDHVGRLVQLGQSNKVGPEGDNEPRRSCKAV